MHLLDSVERERRWVSAAFTRNADLVLEHIHLECEAATKLVSDAIELGERCKVPMLINTHYRPRYRAKHKMRYQLFLAIPFAALLFILLCISLSGLFESNPQHGLLVAVVGAVLSGIGEIIRQYSGMNKELNRMRRYNVLMGDYNTKLTCANMLMHDFNQDYKPAKTVEELTEKCAEYEHLFNLFDHAHHGIEEELNQFQG